jgi:chromosome segregation protein
MAELSLAQGRILPLLSRRQKAVDDPQQEIKRLQRELEQAIFERKRMAQLVHQQPDVKKLDETQALLQAAEVARQATDERNLELMRLLSQASLRQQQLEHDLLEQQRQTHQQLADLQTTLGSLQQERDELFERASKQMQPNSSEVAIKLHSQLKQLHQTSKEKLETLAEELKRRHALWEQEMRNRQQLEQSFQVQSETFQREIQELKQKLREAQSDLADHEFALETNEDQISWLEDEIEEREQIIDGLRGQIAAYLEKLRTAQSKLHEAGAALQQRNTLLKQFQEQRLMLASQARSWEASYNKAEGERVQLADQIHQLRTRVEDLEWELEETRVSLEESQHQVASLQDQIFQQLPEAHRRLRASEERVRLLEGRLSGEDTLMDLPAIAEKSAEM